MAEFENDTVQKILDCYPPFFKKAYEENKTIVMSGINFNRISFTEALYFLLRDDSNSLYEMAPSVSDHQNLNIENTAGGMVVHNEENEKTRAVEREEKTDRSESEICFCKRLQDANEDNFMMACDNCIRWFHPLCYKISKYQRSQLNDKNVTWFCKNCTNAL